MSDRDPLTTPEVDDLTPYELDGPAEPDDRLDPAPPARDLSREVGLAAAAVQVIAAALCLLAPFRAVYTLRQGAISASFDGWGRYSLAGSGGQHSARYGVVITVAAVVLVLAAASRLRDLVGGDAAVEAAYEPFDDADLTTSEVEAAVEVAAGDGPVLPRLEAEGRDGRLATTIGVAGSALLLGVLAAVALVIESTVSNASSIARSTGDTTTVDVGALLWFLLAAWVLSVLAVLAPWYELRRRT